MNASSTAGWRSKMKCSFGLLVNMQATTWRVELFSPSGKGQVKPAHQLPPSLRPSLAKPTPQVRGSCRSYNRYAGDDFFHRPLVIVRRLES